MFVVLDTNHFTELALGSRLGKRLSERLEHSEPTLFPASSPLKSRFRAGFLLFDDTGQAESKWKAMLAFSLASKRLQS